MKFDIIAVSHQSSLEFDERIINCENNLKEYRKRHVASRKLLILIPVW
jgi:hypothetical protein